MTTTDSLEEMCKNAEPQKEHRWLTSFLGNWTMEAECLMGPDQPPVKSEATESVKSVGDLWIVAEGECSMPDGNPGITRMTLGFDPVKKRFVGTWIGSMMTHQWVYDGELDDTERILTLNAEGPAFNDPTKSAKYQDIYEIVDNNHRILRSRVLMDNGEWVQFMTANYHRVK